MKVKVFADTNGRRWTISDLINKGAFGSIYSAVLDNRVSSLSLERVAVKIQRRSASAEIEEFVYGVISNEYFIENFKKTIHINFLGLSKLYGHATIRDRVYLVMPHYSMNLRRYMKENIVSKRRVFKFAIHVLNAIEFLHSHRILHRDIKADNIVFDTTKNPFLIDFGLCAPIGGRRHRKTINHFDGTLNYCSVYGHTGHLTRASDIENLLHCIFVWLRLQVPWKNLKVREVFELKIVAKREKYRNIVKDFNWAESMDRVSIFHNMVSNIAQLARWQIPNYAFLRLQLHRLAVTDTKTT